MKKSLNRTRCLLMVVVGFLVLAYGAQQAAYAAITDDDWSAFGSGMNDFVDALAVDGSGNLYAGGNFTTAGGVTANYIAKWDGTGWSTLGSGMDSGVIALAADSSGNLYAGGNFATAGGVTVNCIAKWDGTSWSALGSGMNGTVYALAVDGSGNLYAGGYFTTAGGVAANHIAKWNGSSWSALGSGTYGSIGLVLGLTTDTSGNLYAGGVFTTAGGVTVNSIAKWNGTSWSALGSGMGGVTYPDVSALAFDNLGNLYAGGGFITAGGMTTNYIAKWDGTSWSALGSGVNNSVIELVVDGAGNLYACGDFTTAGGVTANYIAKWDGTSWSALGSGMNGRVRALAYDGLGNLYAGGDFTTAGTKVAPYIARCNNIAGSTTTTTVPTTTTSVFIDCQLIMSSIPAGAGTTSPSVGGGHFIYGCSETITFEAYPAEGYHFSRWEGSIQSQENPVTVTVSGNASVTAVFVPNDLTTTTVPTTTTTCPVPALTAPDGAGISPRPAFTWQKTDGVTWYNVQVWSESANNYAMSQWYDPAVICDATTCTATAPNALYPGRYWWWLNVWYADKVCGFKIQAGGQYKGFTVEACAGPDLAAPDNSAPVAYRSTPAFLWQDTGIEWYAVQIYMPAGWIKTNWYEGAVVCDGTDCTATPLKAVWLGQHWWWLLTWSVDCGYQLQPGGKVLGFVVQ